jgi:hypothetical protein
MIGATTAPALLREDGGERFRPPVNLRKRENESDARRSDGPCCKPGCCTGFAMSDAKIKVTRYLFFLALEVAGMALILWDGLPIYRHLFVLERVATTEDKAIMLVAVIAIQISYWHTLRHRPPFEFSRRPFLAHVLLFLSRLSFVFASSLFALVAYRYSSMLSLNPLNLALFIAILFSVFCFTRHLEAVGNLMLKGPAAD